MTGVCFEIGEASRTANIIENNFRSMLFHTLGILDPPMEGFEPDSRVRDLKIACFEGPMILRASAGKVVGVEVGDMIIFFRFLVSIGDHPTNTNIHEKMCFFSKGIKQEPLYIYAPNDV